MNRIKSIACPVLLTVALGFSFSAGAHAEQAPVILTLEAGASAKPISLLFSGLSMETEMVTPEANGGVHYFSPSNKVLVATFRQLGLRHLRIGGNTVDDKTKTPSLADIDELFAFAKAAGLKVTYSVRLKKGDPEEDALIVKYIYDHYKDLVTGITIGNEVGFYYPKYPLYLQKVTPFIMAIKAAAPEATVNGPSASVLAGPSIVCRTFLQPYQDDVGKMIKIEYLNAHSYAGGSAYGGSKPPMDQPPAPMRAAMLSPKWVGGNERMLKLFDQAIQTGVPFRIDECNTYYVGGAKDASDSMAAAIWALDYLYWWAAHGAQGVNFHNGTTLPFLKGKLPGGATRKPCYYASFWGVEGGYRVQAVGYGLKTFAVGGQGSIFPVAIDSTDKANVTAYAVKAEDGSVYLTVINKEIGMPEREVVLNQPQNARFGSAKSMALVARNHSDAAIEGFTLGGEGIATDGSWNGTWSDVPLSGETITLRLPATSALVVHLGK